MSAFDFPSPATSAELPICRSDFTSWESYHVHLRHGINPTLIMNSISRPPPQPSTNPKPDSRIRLGSGWVYYQVNRSRSLQPLLYTLFAIKKIYVKMASKTPPPKPPFLYTRRNRQDYNGSNSFRPARGQSKGHVPCDWQVFTSATLKRIYAYILL